MPLTQPELASKSIRIITNIKILIILWSTGTFRITKINTTKVKISKHTKNKFIIDRF